MPLERAYRITSWRYAHGWKVLVFPMALLLSLIGALLLSEKQAWAVELPHNQQQAEQSIAGESTKIMRGTPSLQRTSIGELPQVRTPLQGKPIQSSLPAPGPASQPPLSKEDQRGSWPLTSSLGPSSLRPEAYPQPQPQGKKPEDSPPLTPYPESVSQTEPSPNYYYQYYYHYYQYYYQKEHSTSSGFSEVSSRDTPSEKRGGLLPWASYPRLASYPESVPESELFPNYYQKDRSTSARFFPAPSEGALSEAKSMQTSNPKYSYQEDYRTTKAEPFHMPSRDTNWQPKSAPTINNKGAQASPGDTSKATKPGVSWAQKQPTSSLLTLPLQKSELPNLIEDKDVLSGPLSTAARVKALSTMPTTATRAPALLALALLLPTKEAPLHPLLEKVTMANRDVHSMVHMVQPSIHKDSSYALGLLKGQRGTLSSGETEEPMKGTPQPSSPSAPPVENSNFFALLGGGQAGLGTGVSSLLLLGVLILVSSVSCSEDKLKRVLCVFTKPSSALLDPLECPG